VTWFSDASEERNISVDGQGGTLEIENTCRRIYIYLVFVSRFLDGGTCRAQKIIKLHILPARIWLSIFLGFFSGRLGSEQTATIQ
jgi:hypothetical protein